MLHDDGSGDLTAARAANADRAGSLADRAATDMVIYGEAFRDRVELVLTSPSGANNGRGDTYEVAEADRRLVLSTAFGTDIGALIAVKAISLTNTTDQQQARSVVDAMRGALWILTQLADHPPNGLSQNDKASLFRPNVLRITGSSCKMASILI